MFRTIPALLSLAMLGCVEEVDDGSTSRGSGVLVTLSDSALDADSDDAKPPQPFGALEADCTPDHRQAWAMLLAPSCGGCGFDGTVEDYRIYVAPPVPIAPQTTWVVGPGVEAFLCPPEDAPWERIPSGEIHFDQYREGAEAVGSWNFVLADGRAVAGTFNIACFGATSPPECWRWAPGGGTGE